MTTVLSPAASSRISPRSKIQRDSARIVQNFDVHPSNLQACGSSTLCSSYCTVTQSVEGCISLADKPTARLIGAYQSQTVPATCRIRCQSQCMAGLATSGSSALMEPPSAATNTACACCMSLEALRMSQMQTRHIARRMELHDDTAACLNLRRALEMTDFRGNAWAGDFTLSALITSFVRLQPIMALPCELTACMRWFRNVMSSRNVTVVLLYAE